MRYLKGVGPRRAERLKSLGIETVGDMLLHLPRDYEDRREVCSLSSVRVGQRCVVGGTIIGCELRPTRARRRAILEVWIEDGTGVLQLAWFNASQKWAQSFPVGAQIVAYGEVGYYRGLQMVSPDYEVGPAQESGKFGCILPVYPLTEGVPQRVMRGLQRAALAEGLGEVPEVLPDDLRGRKGLLSAAEALREAHFPSDMKRKDAAWRRLTYEELFVFQVALALRRVSRLGEEGIAFRVGPNVDRRIRRLFPFSFTGAQERAVAEIVADMRAGRPMNRLLQGDVGCGKTAVAVYALLAALAEKSKGYQVALMAPTEILAEQHYLTLQFLLKDAKLEMLFLTGALEKKRRQEALRRIAGGRAGLVVGTHALIQTDVRFRRLALVVVDEQHRFGVQQRMALKQKGLPPDVLIMTATPIPRTLAMACLGDMDVSVIDEMPPGRLPGQTFLYPPERWQEAFSAALAELERGRRVFVVYPLVEEDRDLDLTSAVEGFEELSGGVFREYKCCLLHGQMRPERKQRVMEGFRDGQFQVMVATTVIEVGIDVPEATVMIVQHAERLGLAQLHQLRGRIGRGAHAGRCYLLAEPVSEDALRRLTVLTRTSDGFLIAEEDLRIRGPGQVFGTQQSGMPELRCYDFSDTKILEEARDDAFALVRGDPSLAKPRHRRLRQEVLKQYGRRLALGSVG